MELKPCPFCGNDAMRSSSGERVCCKNETCILFPYWYKLHDWQAPRPLEDTLIAQRDELLENVERLHKIGITTLGLLAAMRMCNNIHLTPEQLVVYQQVQEELQVTLASSQQKYSREA